MRRTTRNVLMVLVAVAMATGCKVPPSSYGFSETRLVLGNTVTNELKYVLLNHCGDDPFCFRGFFLNHTEFIPGPGESPTTAKNRFNNALRDHLSRVVEALRFIEDNNKSATACLVISSELQVGFYELDTGEPCVLGEPLVDPYTLN